MSAAPHALVEEAMLGLRVAEGAGERRYSLEEAAAAELGARLSSLGGTPALLEACRELASFAYFLHAKGHDAPASRLLDLLALQVDALRAQGGEGSEFAGKVADAAAQAGDRFKAFGGEGAGTGVLGGSGPRPAGTTAAGPVARFALKLPGED
jgi:hypothetical protein